MKSKIKVGIVEDQLLFREGIKAILINWDIFEIVFESADGFSVIDKLEKLTDLPDILMVDLSLPPLDKKEYSGLHLTIALAEKFPEIKVLILSVHNDENFMAELIKNGAHGYLVKDCNPLEVYQAIVAIAEKGSYINSRVLKAIQDSMAKKAKPGKKLLTYISPREEEVLKLTCQQFTADEIAEKLFISVKTVNGHRNNLLLKTGSRNVTGLVTFAIRNNIVQL
ncbi:response regulator transcription factor [Pedobacter alluvionis]|jgi:DNA-binding NarL/FixJ family response regulator|uniref:LuxR family two component transcriptional regulator n=1 Tax=Pedobacter alluvionis TaxID=475253 RepID=A0A497YA33_9SPHI|nr:response regulator transcription factor [Pedobacter alluvionis]RLJ79588.1 LuxR family two component transcriptional regulator [Pedobacter alluvionis]TFB30922.1 response regulator transcription factor [Pedobacter alluvionis]